MPCKSAQFRIIGNIFGCPNKLFAPCAAVVHEMSGGRTSTAAGIQGQHIIVQGWDRECMFDGCHP